MEEKVDNLCSFEIGKKAPFVFQVQNMKQRVAATAAFCILADRCRLIEHSISCFFLKVHGDSRRKNGRFNGMSIP